MDEAGGYGPGQIRVEMVLLTMGVAAVIAAGGWWLISQGEVRGVEVIAAADRQATPAAVMIDVAGAVERPGLYTLPKGALVNDALAAAGGLGDEADAGWVEKNLNRAAVVETGMKLYIPRVTVRDVSAETGEAGERVGVNSATAVQLEQLPGIGPATAARIVAKRPFLRVEELVEKEAVNSSQFEKIKDLVGLW